MTFLITYSITAGAIKTITKPIKEKSKDLFASSIFLESPIEKIYLKPASIKDITAKTTEMEIA